MTEYEITHGLSQDDPGPLEPVEVAKVPESMNTEWKLVPVEPTDEMEVAAENDYEQTGATFPRWKSAYAAMLAAAPSCLTCGGHGMVGGLTQHSGYDAQPCPDCTPAPTSHPIPTGATGEDERQAFEAWADDNGFALDCDFFEVSGQYYDHDDTQLAYDIWRAARASVGAPAAGDALDAARYRWLRDPKADPALVLDKRTGYVPEDESVPGVGGYHTYEYRAGEELDAAIDAALAAQIPQQGEA